MQANIERACSLPFESFLMPNNYAAPPRPVSLDIAHVENTVDERFSDTSSQYSLSQLSTLSQLSMVHSSSDSLSEASTPASPSPVPLIFSTETLGGDVAQERQENKEISNAESWKQRGKRYASNMGAVLLRNTLSVAVGTEIREYVRRGALSETFANLPRSSLTLISSIVIATPLVLQLSGLARDYCNGGLNGSVFMGRLSSLLFVAVSGMCLWYSDNFEHAALLLVAGLAYVLLRVSKKNRALSVKLAMRNKEDYTRKSIMDCTLNTIASRASIIVSAYAAACALPFGGHAAKGQ